MSTAKPPLHWWNYRVLKFVSTDTVYSVHEVHYERKEDGTASLSWTADPVGPHGEDKVDFLSGLRLFLAAFSKPILVIENDVWVSEEEW